MSFLDVFRVAGLSVPPPKDEAFTEEYLRVIGSALGGFSAQPRPDDYTDQLRSFRVSTLVYRCAQLWAESILQAPLRIFEVRDQKVIKEITNGDIWDVLTEVNGHMAYHEWMYVNILNMALTGNSYTWKVRNRIGQVVELWPMRPDEFEISYDPLFDPKGKLRYDWRPISTGGVSGKGGPYQFKSTSILHLRLPSPLSNVYGTGPVRPSHDDIIADQQAKRSTVTMLTNEGIPAGVLQTDQTLTKDQADIIKERWRDAHAGPERRGKIAVLGAGTKFVPITVSPKDIEWLNQRKLSRAGILMSFGVPPIYGGMEGENFANRKEQRLLFWQDTIRPKLRLVEAQMTEFFARDFNPYYVIKFDESRVDAFVEALIGRIGAAVQAANPVSRVMRPYEVRERILGISERFEGDDEFAAMPGQETGGGLADLFGPPKEEKPAPEETPEGEEGEAASAGIELPNEKELFRIKKFEKLGIRRRSTEAEFMRSLGRAFKRVHSGILQKLTNGREDDDKITEAELKSILPSRKELETMLLDASGDSLRRAFREGVSESLEDIDEARKKGKKK